jgi:hypothetical protein
MNTKLTLAALLLAALPSLAVEPILIEKKDFTITLPPGFAPFTVQTQTTRQKEGTFETTTYISKNPAGDAVVVTETLLPAKVSDPDHLLAGTRDSLLKSLNATLEKEEKIAGDPPRTRLFFHSNATPPVYFESLLTAKGDRLYQVLYITRTPAQRDAATPVFDSFRVSS